MATIVIWSQIMGKIVLAAKTTHVPTMLMSEMDGPLKGKRQAAIDGHKEIGRWGRHNSGDRHPLVGQCRLSHKRQAALQRGFYQQ